MIAVATTVSSYTPVQCFKATKSLKSLKTDVRGQRVRNKKIINFKTFELSPKSPSVCLLEVKYVSPFSDIPLVLI